jgi:hypothetical protein
MDGGLKTTMSRLRSSKLQRLRLCRADHLRVEFGYQPLRAVVTVSGEQSGKSRWSPNIPDSVPWRRETAVPLATTRER